MAVTEKPLYYLSIHEAQQLIQKRQLSPLELIQSVLERIQAIDDKLHAYIKLMPDSAMRKLVRLRRKSKRATGGVRCTAFLLPSKINWTWKVRRRGFANLLQESVMPRL